MDDESVDIEFSQELPMLYHEGKKRKWKVWVVGNVVFRNDGLSSKEFVKKPSERKITAKKGKSPEDQALIEAKKFWIKKLDQGFAPAEDDEEGREMYDLSMDVKKKQGGNNHGLSKEKGSKTSKASTIDVGEVKHLPMLAQKYEERINSVIWTQEKKAAIVKKIGKESFYKKYFDASNGCFITTKLDGVHCLAYLNDQKQTVLLTRNGKQFVFLEHVRKAVKSFLESSDKTHLILTGELYVHAPKINGLILEDVERFQYISSACRTVRSDPHEDEKQIQFHVFDLLDPTNREIEQTDRLTLLKSLFTACKDSVRKIIIPVRMSVGKTHEDVLKYQGKFAEEDYEGVILRNPHGVYEGGKKSIHLLKYKAFDDKEFVIVGAESAQGSCEGAVVWVCETEDGENTFMCSMKGNRGKSCEMYENYTDYLGKLLTVRYQGMNDNGIPRFPRGVTIRDYEN